MSEPDDSKMSPLRKQIAIVFASSVVLTSVFTAIGALLKMVFGGGL